jgi:hypothetical protein
MVRGHCLQILLGSLACAAILVAASPTPALVIDPAEPPLGTHPPDGVVGQWMTNASCVVVGPDMVITVRHAGGTTPGATLVTIGGVQYKVVEFFNHGSADLRLARLTTLGGQPANLSAIATLYTTADESGMTVTMGGYGVGPGAPLPGGNGWAWADATSKMLRWGANVVTGAVANQTNAPYRSDTITSAFDSAGIAGEAMIAVGDSGGGWFKAGTTQLMGISAYASTLNEAVFGDTAYAIRASTYASWATGEIGRAHV